MTSIPCKRKEYYEGSSWKKKFLFQTDSMDKSNKKNVYAVETNKGRPNVSEEVTFNKGKFKQCDKGWEILIQMGYRDGKGGGRNLQGRISPVKVAPSNRERSGLGWTGDQSLSNNDENKINIKW